MTARHVRVVSPQPTTWPQLFRMARVTDAGHSGKMDKQASTSLSFQGADPLNCCLSSCSLGCVGRLTEKVSCSSVLLRVASWSVCAAMAGNAAHAPQALLHVAVGDCGTTFASSRLAGTIRFPAVGLRSIVRKCGLGVIAGRSTNLWSGPVVRGTFSDCPDSNTDRICIDSSDESPSAVRASECRYED